MRRASVALWLRLAHVFRKVDRVMMDQLRSQELSLAQFDVLAQVGRREGLSQQEVADALLVTKGNVCQLLDRMERAGLLQRQQEGRTNRLFLTEAGQQLYATAVPAHEALIAQQFAALSATEQAQLRKLLRKLDRALS
jgi:DNA-binding MarR family transcriptional regulator